MSRLEDQRNLNGDGQAVDGHELLFPELPYEGMKNRVKGAVKNVQLQQFVNSATLKKDVARKAMMEQTFGANVLKAKELAGEIKQHALDHLDYYLEQFIENAEKSGAVVHLAKDAEQAREIALAIARQNGSTLCVKSKSMVTEEVQLLDAFEGAGIETVETDLGEFILQLDHDAPSHIVTPMIHKNRVSVAEAFTRELGAAYTENPQELTTIAREHLRKKFAKADLGMSGGNFLIAETGGVVICTNEGNGRLSTSVAKVHIAMVGIEKLIPRQEHLGAMLKVLTRSSTGQPLTCYTHIMTGPKRELEVDGPEQMHIVLVDNGRCNALGEETREMLRCIRCGACLNTCPVYRKIGGHSYGAVYPGPIGSILTPMLKGMENYKDLPNASSLCGACYDACPVRINIPKQLIHHRRVMNEQKMNSWGERLMMKGWTIAYSSKTGYLLSNRLQRMMSRLIARQKEGGGKYVDRGWVKRMRGPLKGWTDQKDLPTPPSRQFRDWWSRDHDSKGDE
ncbi:Lactate utilization protein B [Poriferisphaera corsica]|uniref:Lactate utilization protein B n=1 Tax=Poriferisphaera corsica TaxID=2528020 RepID=A0A517YQH8_9BACT|nr:LutB/LldF family L-lactate oxidation iron-sulfur protein [Poriferisphaera corsica]QDU32482.1 Lactate utilization protein B [Poriferisphaera corsica]